MEVNIILGIDLINGGFLTLIKFQRFIQQSQQNSGGLSNFR